MYLKSLVLKGFKSFADRSVLSLEPGITAIVGPNGSGKSNISDAVLWVLGERNAKHLRGQAMEDVIFAGSSARKATGLAEVDLVLDNSDGTLPVDYSEVAITRRMDVLDILHDSGLGTGTHSIISQGSLDSILQSKPEDRRALIEEAAGVLKHKQRKAKSERKLEQMDQHLARARDVVAEVERQLGPLERKAKRARAYQGLAAELSELNLQLAVDDLRVLQRKWDEASTREQALEAELEDRRGAIARAEARAEELQEKIRLESVDDVGLICDRDHLLQLPSDLFCEVLAPRDLSTPAYVGTFVERINAVRSRRPVQVVTFDGEGDFPEGMLGDPTVAPVVRRVAGFDESVLENIAHELDEETEPPQETEER